MRDGSQDPAATAESTPPDSAARFAAGVAQLRSSIGLWNVTTAFLDDSGKVARSVAGTYRFDWLVPDRIVSGRSDVPELKQTSGILFYVRERKQEIEMASVGVDGRLWVMTGPIDGEVRTTPDVSTIGGGTMRLCFTRHSITPGRFERFPLEAGRAILTIPPASASPVPRDSPRRPTGPPRPARRGPIAE